MKNPSEIIYWEILPAIRRELVNSLKKKNLKQSEIASLMDITPSAVSLYLKNKRAEDIEFTEKFRDYIGESADKIAERESSVFEEINKLIKYFEREESLCHRCRKENNLDNSCKICFD